MEVMMPTTRADASVGRTAPPPAVVIVGGAIPSSSSSSFRPRRMLMFGYYLVSIGMVVVGGHGDGYVAASAAAVAFVATPHHRSLSVVCNNRYYSAGTTTGGQQQQHQHQHQQQQQQCQRPSRPGKKEAVVVPLFSSTNLFYRDEKSPLDNRSNVVGVEQRRRQRQRSRSKAASENNSNKSTSSSSSLSSSSSDFASRMKRIVVQQKRSTSSTTTSPSSSKRYRPTNVVMASSLEEFAKVIDQGRREDRVIVVRFYATWCKTCHALRPSFDKAASSNPNVIFVDVPVLETNSNLHQGLGVESVPFGHIYHPTRGLVEERKLSRKTFVEFQDLIGVHCS